MPFFSSFLSLHPLTGSLFSPLALDLCSSSEFSFAPSSFSSPHDSLCLCVVVWVCVSGCVQRWTGSNVVPWQRINRWSFIPLCLDLFKSNCPLMRICQRQANMISNLNCMHPSSFLLMVFKVLKEKKRTKQCKNDSDLSHSLVVVFVFDFSLLLSPIFSFDSLGHHFSFFLCRALLSLQGAWSCDWFSSSNFVSLPPLVRLPSPLSSSRPFLPFPTHPLQHA